MIAKQQRVAQYMESSKYRDGASYNVLVWVLRQLMLVALVRCFLSCTTAGVARGSLLYIVSQLLNSPYLWNADISRPKSYRGS